MGALGMWTGAFHEDGDPLGKYRQPITLVSLPCPVADSRRPMSVSPQVSSGSGVSAERSTVVRNLLSPLPLASARC